MKRLTTFLLAVAIAMVGFSAAPASAIGTAPVITSPTSTGSYVGDHSIDFIVDFSGAGGLYNLDARDTTAADGADPAAHDQVLTPGLPGDVQTFSHVLAPGDYTFTITDVTTSDTVASVSFTVTPPITKPSKPRHFHSARGNHKVRVAWTAPSSNGGARVTGYQVKRRGSVHHLGASTRSTTFKRLTNGHKYTFYVRAKNKVGWSKWVHTTGTPKAPKPKPKPKPSHPAKAYKNCTAMHSDYPHGVGKPGAVDHGGSVTNFYRSTAIYNQNTKSDRDKDGIACESA